LGAIESGYGPACGWTGHSLGILHQRRPGKKTTEWGFMARKGPDQAGKRGQRPVKYGDQGANLLT